jgi:hypothetical protein
MSGLLRRLFETRSEHHDSPMAVVRRAAADTPPRRGRPRNRRPAIYRGYETLEVVGESFCQDALWALVGMTRGSRVREQIVAVLEPEPTNPWDCNAIQVLIDDVPVGHLSREDARAYLPGLLRLIESCETRCVGLEGVITGGGTRSDGPGFLGVFLDHDPTHFGVRRHFVSMEGELRTGYSQARMTDLADDSYDLSWADTLAADDWSAASEIEQLLVDEQDPIDRHFMFTQLSEGLYRCRGSHPEALERFDDACSRHDAEMPSLRPVLLEKFGAVPVIKMYRQAVIRCQKSKDWDRMRWWAERGIAVYGDQAARPAELLDLQKRLAYATAKLRAPQRRSHSERAGPMTPVVAEIEELVCAACGRPFERPRVRGRKPIRCPDCR